MSADKSGETRVDEAGSGSKACGGVSWVGVFVACVLTSMLTIGVNTWLQRDTLAGGSQRYVFLDARRLIDAKALEINARGLGEEEGAKEGTAFADAMKLVVAEYHSKGFTVMNGAALLSESEDADVTSDVAKKLGVDLELKGIIDGGSTSK